MCLIAFAWKAHPRWRLLLAGNRDEFHARRSAPAGSWSAEPAKASAGGKVPSIIGGRDLEAGGTWLGVATGGLCSAVTNVRDPAIAQLGMSRGRLVTEYLLENEGAATHAPRLLEDAADYRPFNLLLFDAASAFYVGNRPQPHAHVITPGVHGLSNADFDTPWPKTRAMMQQLHRWMTQHAEDEDFTELFQALADRGVAPDGQLPHTGVGIERERWLSSAFICGEQYGTRASTVVAIGYDGQGVLIERRFGPNGRFEGETLCEICA